LTLDVRTNFANDPLELLAVSGAANQQKGDADAATWLPPNKSFRCSYVAIQVAVKIRYHLWVTPAEHDAIAKVLSTCPTQPLAGGSSAGASPTGVSPPTPTTLSPTSAPATDTAISVISVTSPVDAGAYASLVARTTPRATCDLSVTLPSGRQSESSGLVRTVADASGLVKWTWLTGTNTKPGTATATATVTCGSTSATTTTFQFSR
jgi:hypothetical protein